MFDVPSAKRIKRSELEAQRLHTEESPPPLDQSTSAHSTPDGNPIDYGFEYDFVTLESSPHKPPLQPHPSTEQRDGEDEDEKFEFRLFSAGRTETREADTALAGLNSSIKAPSQLITLTRSPSPTSKLHEPEGRLVRQRPDTAYFSVPNTASKAQYASAAITPATLATLSHTPWPGDSYAWRVQHIPQSKLHKTLRTSPVIRSVAPATDINNRRRPKPSKKSRIHQRKRLLARLRSQPKPKPTKVVNEKGELELDLPPEEREKRTARNREKKVKRRQRERERKAAAGSGGAGIDDDDAVAAEGADGSGDGHG